MHNCLNTFQMKIRKNQFKSHKRTVSSGGSMLGQGGTGPLNLAQAPQIFRAFMVHKLLNTGQLDTVVLLVVASQMMRGQAPQIFFFPRTAPDS